MALLFASAATVAAAPAAKGPARAGAAKSAAKDKGKIVPLSPGRGPRVSLDVRGIDVRTVLTVLGESAKVRFSIAPDVSGRVSHNQRDLALEDMLDAVLPPLGLRWKRLSAGLYRVERAVEKKTGKALLTAARGWDPAGLKAVYYNDQACELPDGGLSALLALPPEGTTPVTRTDARPGGSWGGTEPAPGVGPDHWSARWKGRLWVPADDAYRFFFDPARGAALLLLDGKLALDGWETRAPGKLSGKPVKLTRGWHEAVIEYHQVEAQGALGLKWQAAWLPCETIGSYKTGKPASGGTRR